MTISNITRQFVKDQLKNYDSEKPGFFSWKRAEPDPESITALRHFCSTLNKTSQDIFFSDAEIYTLTKILIRAIPDTSEMRKKIHGNTPPAVMKTRAYPCLSAIYGELKRKINLLTAGANFFSAIEILENIDANTFENFYRLFKQPHHQHYSWTRILNSCGILKDNLEAATQLTNAAHITLTNLHQARKLNQTTFEALCRIDQEQDSRVFLLTDTLHANRELNATTLTTLLKNPAYNLFILNSKEYQTLAHNNLKFSFVTQNSGRKIVLIIEGVTPEIHEDVTSRTGNCTATIANCLDNNIANETVYTLLRNITAEITRRRHIEMGGGLTREIFNLLFIHVPQQIQSAVIFYLSKLHQIDPDLADALLKKPDLATFLAQQEILTQMVVYNLRLEFKILLAPPFQLTAMMPSVKFIQDAIKITNFTQLTLAQILKCDSICEKHTAKLFKYVTKRPAQLEKISKHIDSRQNEHKSRQIGSP